MAIYHLHVKNISRSAGRVPTGPEIDLIQGHVGVPGSQTGVRPVPARVIVIPGELVSVPLTIRLRPDTVRTCNAVTEAFGRFIDDRRRGRGRQRQRQPDRRDH